MTQTPSDRASKRLRVTEPTPEALNAAKNRLPLQPEPTDLEEEPAGASGQTRTLREIIMDQKSGVWSKSALEGQRTKSKKLSAPENDQVDEVSVGEESVVGAIPEPATTRAPQVRIIDGRIVLDQSSLTFTTGPSVPQGLRSVVDEGSSGKVVNSSSFTKRSASKRWDAASTDRFYNCLSKYGTDFSMIAELFPDRTRKHIHNKFKLEERQDPCRVDAALFNRRPVDLDDFPIKVREDVVEISEEGLQIVDETPGPTEGSSEGNEGAVLSEAELNETDRDGETGYNSAEQLDEDSSSHENREILDEILS